MNSNSGSIAGATSHVAEQSGEQKKSFKTLPFEIACACALIAICVVLMVKWQKIPVNQIDIETGFVGPFSEQTLGVKVVRDYDKNSPYKFHHTKDSTGHDWYDVSTDRYYEGYLSQRYNIVNDGYDNILYGQLTQRPGVHIGLMTHILSTCDKPIDTNTLRTKKGGFITYKDVEDAMMFLKNPVMPYWIDEHPFSDSVGLATRLFVRSGGMSSSVKEIRSGRKDLRPHREWTSPIWIKKSTLNFYNIGKIRIDTELENDMTKDQLLGLFGYDPGLEESPKISADRLLELFLSQCQVDIINREPNSVVWGDRIIIPSRRGQITDSLINPHPIFFGNPAYGTTPTTEEPGKAVNTIFFSPIGQTHQLIGQSYVTSDFIKPSRLFTMNDLSRTNEIITIRNKKVRLMKLEYDFRTSIDNVTYSIKPDDIRGTNIVYTTKDKLQKIVNEGLQLSAHFPEWESTQTKRFFILTLIITIAVSYLCRRLFTQWLVEKQLNGMIVRKESTRIIWILALAVAVAAAVICLILCI